MSEEQAEYITDALEMMGLMEPKQIVTEISGFVPVFDVVLKAYKDPITAVVFGRMWQYCGMTDGVCRASLEKIGTDLGISAATVMRHAALLVRDEYLIDTTPTRRNAPHEYLDGRKVEMKGRIEGGIAQRRPTVSQRNATVSESQLIKQDNTKIKQEPVFLTAEEKEQAGQKVEKILALQGGGENYWQGRELFADASLPLADWYVKTTGQVATKRVTKAWYKALGEWQAEGLDVQSLQAAYDNQVKWRVVSDPNMLTKDAVAIKAAGRVAPASPLREEGKSSGYYG